MFAVMPLLLPWFWTIAAICETRLGQRSAGRGPFNSLRVQRTNVAGILEAANETIWCGLGDWRNISTDGNTEPEALVASPQLWEACDPCVLGPDFDPREECVQPGRAETEPMAPRCRWLSI